MDTDALSPAPAAAPTSRRWPKVLMAAVLVAGIAIGSATTAVWAAHQFPDVPDSNPFHDDIDWLVDNDIATGFQDGTFKPTQPVTRQSMAAFLHRYNDEIELVNVTQPFNGTNVAVTASCPDGKRPVGGGGGSSAISLFLTDSYPSANTWYTRWETVGGATASGNAWAYVACVPM